MTHITRPEKGPVDFATTATGVSDKTDEVEAGDDIDSKDRILLNEEENEISPNNLVQPLLLTASTLPPPPPIFTGHEIDRRRN